MDYPKEANTSPSSIQNNRIIVYTSKGCSKCLALKEWLKTVNKEFEERSLENLDVMTDLVMRNLVVLSAPALEVGEILLTEDQIFLGDCLATDKLLGFLERKADGQW